jgi:peptide/nickel transport system permease protein
VSDRDVRDLHAARNAMLPIVSKMVVSIPYLMAGLVIIEVASGVRGIGSMLFYATNMRDIPLMLGALVVIGLLTLVLRLALDVITALLDPRIRVEAASEVIRSP